jgi:DNA-binding XRE family transcriptional regulator
VEQVGNLRPKEIARASTVIDARSRAGLTQGELARKMWTTQPVVARLESGRTRPSMRTLERLAEATGLRLLISFEPRAMKRPAGVRKSNLGFVGVRGRSWMRPGTPVLCSVPQHVSYRDSKTRCTAAGSRSMIVSNTRAVPSG